MTTFCCSSDKTWVVFIDKVPLPSGCEKKVKTFLCVSILCTCVKVNVYTLSLVHLRFYINNEIQLHSINLLSSSLHLLEKIYL